MSKGDFVDYYDLLEVKSDALLSDIRTAFMKHAKQQHPDAGGTLEQMQLLNKAYATLKDPLSRRSYDRMHSFQTGNSTIQYRGDTLGSDDSGVDMSDEEMDEFIDIIFAEYSAKPPKQPLHKKAASTFFRRSK